MLEIGTKIRRGTLEKKPVKQNDRTGCTYSAYRGVCGFDAKMPGFNYENVTLSEEEAMRRIMSKEK